MIGSPGPKGPPGDPGIKGEVGNQGKPGSRGRSGKPVGCNDIFIFDLAVLKLKVEVLSYDPGSSVLALVLALTLG